jgi:hypothetical protein
MDMSFAFVKRAEPVSLAVSMADIVAAADARREEIPALFGAGALLRGQEKDGDSVHALARLVVTGGSEMAEAAELQGSFSPFVAKQLSKGKNG